MNKRFAMLLFPLALSAHAGWKIDLGVVSIGGGGNPVFGPGGGINLGGGGGRGGGGMAPGTPGTEIPTGPRGGLPPILGGPMRPGNTITIIGSREDVTRIVDAVGDVFTLGEIGRKRDKERAEAAEREAKAVRDGSEKAKSEKVAGLRRALALAQQNVSDWEDFRSLAPDVLSSLDRILSTAQKELVDRQKLSADLRAAKNSVQDGNLALHLLTALYAKQDEKPNSDGTQLESLDAWVKSGQKLEEIAKNANLSAKDLIARAIASADESTLQNFVQQIGGMRAQVQAMYEVSAEKLRAALIRKEGIERELSALN